MCFRDDTQIQTPGGQRLIADLHVGDEVVTAQDGPQKIVWIGKSAVSTAQLVATPHLRPVRIRAGALGDGIPQSDLYVSPQHRILLSSPIAERMFGQKETFVPAIKLVCADGIEQVSSFAPVTYLHILLDKHQVVFANGASAESLYAGPQALKALSDEARSEILDLFPELDESGPEWPIAHPTIQKQALISKLWERHSKNGKPLVMVEGQAAPKQA